MRSSTMLSGMAASAAFRSPAFHASHIGWRRSPFPSQAWEGAETGELGEVLMSKRPGRRAGAVPEPVVEGGVDGHVEVAADDEAAGLADGVGVGVGADEDAGDDLRLAFLVGLLPALLDLGDDLLHVVGAEPVDDRALGLAA